MATARIIIPQRTYKNGTIAFILQIIHQRVKYRKTICSAPAEHVDRKRLEIKTRYPDGVKLNNKIAKALAEAKAYLAYCEDYDIPVDPQQFFRAGRTGMDVVSRVRVKEEELRDHNKFRTAEKYRVLAQRITDANLNWHIRQINDSWIKKLDSYLESIGNKKNTRGKMLAAIGSVLRQAKKDSLIVRNVFEDYSKPSEDTYKEKLTKEEFEIVKGLQLSGKDKAVRDMFIFATYARGMRAHDVLTLRWESIQGDRLRYRAQKTGKKFDLKITDEMIACLEGLDRGNLYVFSFIKLAPEVYKSDKDRYEKHVNSVNTAVNRIISRIVLDTGIEKHITMHCARHTFSAIGGMKGIALPVMQQLLGHSKMETTAKYMRQVFRNDELDDAVEGIF